MIWVTTRRPYNVRCSYSAKPLVSEVGTREKMCLEHVDNVGAERMCSGRLFQATGPATQNARFSFGPACSVIWRTQIIKRNFTLLFTRVTYSIHTCNECAQRKSAEEYIGLYFSQPRARVTAWRINSVPRHATAVWLMYTQWVHDKLPGSVVRQNGSVTPLSKRPKYCRKCVS